MKKKKLLEIRKKTIERNEKILEMMKDTGYVLVGDTTLEKGLHYLDFEKNKKHLIINFGERVIESDLLWSEHNNDEKIAICRIGNFLNWDYKSTYSKSNA